MMEGLEEIDRLMFPILKAIERHVKDKDAVTEIYNRAYEALIISMDTNGNQDADYDKQLQIETLKAQLAEAENDADRLASRWVVLGQNCCSFCGKPVKWSMIIDAECPIADHAPDCPILHHQKRKEGK